MEIALKEVCQKHEYWKIQLKANKENKTLTKTRAVSLRYETSLRCATKQLMNNLQAHLAHASNTKKANPRNRFIPHDIPKRPTQTEGTFQSAHLSVDGAQVPQSCASRNTFSANKESPWK